MVSKHEDWSTVGVIRLNLMEMIKAGRYPGGHNFPGGNAGLGGGGNDGDDENDNGGDGDDTDATADSSNDDDEDLAALDP